MKKQSDKDKQYRRMAMSRVRADVKRYIAGDTRGMAHLGEYASNMEDAIRTIIALQDLLEISMDKHQKASDLILDQKGRMHTIASISSRIIERASDELMLQGEKLALLTQQHDGMIDECDRLSEGWRKANTEIFELERLVRSLKVTLKDSMKDIPFE